MQEASWILSTIGDSPLMRTNPGGLLSGCASASGLTPDSTMFSAVI